MTERNKEVFRKLIEQGLNKGDLDALDEVCASDLKEHGSVITPPNLEGLKALITSLHTAFPDFRLSIEEISVDGDKVWARLKARGTHRGEFLGMPPTGKSFEVDAIHLCRMKDEKIVEHWVLPDRFALMQQLGLLQLPRERAA